MENNPNLSSSQYKLLVAELGELRVKKAINLDDYIERRVGLEVPALFIATTIRELIKAIDLCKELNITFRVIGSGSKINQTDFDGVGLVIKNRADNLKIYGIKGKVSRSGLGIEEALIEADAGASLDRLAQYSMKQGLGGLESLLGSRYTVGGSLLTQIVVRDNTHQVKILNNLSQVETVDMLEINPQNIILSVIFKLKAKQN
ncbi:MAG: FAD-binding protein [Patescibacteria group bacterium]|nr:FAD-binding protein [Patescibacteria group bacterium]